MRDMTAAERREFLLAGTRTAVLATTSADGAPHAAPIWFLLDGDDVVFTTWHASAKGRNLHRDPRACLVVDDPHPPYSFVHLRGRVAISRDLDDLRGWATALGGRYMGAHRAEEFGARNGVPGELLCRLVPDHVVAKAAVAD